MAVCVPCGSIIGAIRWADLAATTAPVAPAPMRPNVELTAALAAGLAAGATKPSVPAILPAKLVSAWNPALKILPTVPIIVPLAWTPAAAALIYLASDPKIEKIPNFYCGNDEALADMKRLAELEAA